MLSDFRLTSGWKYKHELVLCDRLAEIKLQLPARLHQRVHLWLEVATAVASVTLRLVQSYVGAFQQTIRVAPVARRQGNPDADANNHLMPAIS